jgi:hypothetical protein
LTTGVDEAVDGIVDAAVGRSRVLLSRALDPVLRDALDGRLSRYAELPHISGKTVIPGDVGANDLVVLGHPTYLGGFDDPGAAGHSLLVADGTGMSIRDLPPGAGVVVVGPVVGKAEAVRTRDHARLLVKRMRQTKGVREAFMPASATAILLLPVDPARVAALFGSPSARALAVDYPEFPGGLRVSFPPGIEGVEEHAYAASLQEAIAAVAKG